jgi:hypothetical protein
LYCQAWYFGFQIVQVFLVVTLASAATSTVTAIIDDPSSAMTLLSNNLPKASNFYISYFLLQGLYTSAWTILQAVSLALSHALAFLLNTPRKKWNKLNKLAEPSFGVMYPPQMLMVSIMIIYALIAPIMLIFTTFTLGMFYFVQLYLFTYVRGAGNDLRGRNYPKALLETFVGLYLAEICLLGLFITAKAWGPVALEAVILAASVLVHLYLRYKLERSFDALPISAINAARGDGTEYPRDFGWKEIQDTGKNYGEHTGAAYNADDAATYESKQQIQKNPTVNDSLSSKNETVGEPSSSKARPTQDEINRETDVEKLGNTAKKQPLQVLKKFFSPKDGYSFQLLRSKLPPIFNLTPSYSSEFLENAYYDPAIRDEPLKVWIPADANGVSQYEIQKAQEANVFVTDQDATIDEKGNIDVSGPPPDWNLEIKH